MKELKVLLRLEDREMRKLGRRMSEEVITGSFEIWRQYAKEMPHEKREERDGANELNEMIEIEAQASEIEEGQEEDEEIEAIEGREPLRGDQPIEEDESGRMAAVEED
jgi:hypothetical protein